MSSLYLSWATERGYGTLLVERHGTETAAGRPVNFTMYSPRTRTYEGFLPVVLTIHGASGTKEGMFAFNIELARRDFTVISVDLPGHGESTLPFDLSNYTLLAEDCRAALEFARDRYSWISNSIYGVIGHSVGFHVGLAMYELQQQPTALVGVGPVWLDTIDEYPGNLLLASGMCDEIVHPPEILEVLRRLTGNETAASEVTYGSFDAGDAYRAVFANTNHVGEATNRKIVEESVAWMISSLQGVPRPPTTLPADITIFEMKTLGIVMGTFSFLALTIPLFVLSTELLPSNRLQVSKRIHEFTEDRKKRVAADVSAGLLFVAILALCGYVGIGLESVGLYWIGGMDLSGIGIFFISYSVIMAGLRIKGIGWQGQTRGFLETKPVYGSHLNLVRGTLRIVVPVIFCVGWMLALILLVSLPFGTGPLNTLMLLRFPVGQRALNLVALSIVAIPFLWVDAAWIETLVRKEESPSAVTEMMQVLGILTKKIVPAGFFILALVFGSLALGIVNTSSVLLGVLMIQLLIGNVLSTVMIGYSFTRKRSLWPAVLLGSFIIAWILTTGSPLV